MALQILEGLRYPDKSDIHLTHATSYQLQTSFLPSEDNVPEVDIFCIMGRDECPLCGRKWQECDRRMGHRGRDMLQCEKKRHVLVHKSMHHMWEMQCSYVPTGWRVEYCNVA